MAPPRPHPLARSALAERIDRFLAWSWTLPGNPRPPLEPDYLWQIAAKGFDEEDERAGRSDRDVADFRERIERLCRSLREEARLNALGHTMAYGQLKAAIRTRHRLGRLWRQRPELASTAIAPPIVVAGQMRSGTTRVHRLLVADPAHCGTRFCDSFNPVPPYPDYRPLKSFVALTIAHRVNPWLDTLHPFGATRADEEIGWLSLSLSPSAFEAQWQIPSYVRWSEQADLEPLYREFARILRTDAALAGNARQPRVLKCPQYAEDLDALLANVPTARVIVPRRDRDAVHESTVSLVTSQMAMQSDHVELDRVKEEWNRKLALRDRRLAAALARFNGGVAEVAFDALDADWEGAIRNVYAQLGLRLRDISHAAMQREQRRANAQAHSAHREQIESFAEA